MNRIICILIATVLLAGGVVAQTVYVTPDNMMGWGFLQENPGVAFGAIVAGPDAPPAGIGSVNFTVDGASSMIIGKLGYNGTQISDFTTLEYSTYRSFGGPALAAALQFNIDFDTTDAVTGWQGRLVYEPYHTQTVTTGIWQTWNALDDAAGSGTGNWWFSAGGPCVQATPCTWAEVNTLFPNAAVHPNPTLGAVLFKAGSSWAGGFDGNVDSLTIGVGGDNLTYDFEPWLVATNKNHCKNGGWQTYRRADGSTFRNQGDCIQYVNNGH